MDDRESDGDEKAWSQLETTTQEMATVGDIHACVRLVKTSELKMASTTPNQMDIYRTSSKQMLVTRDPLFVHPSVKTGHYIGRRPDTFLKLAIFVTIINPVLGPVALIFSIMSSNSYKDGDLLYATKWSNYAFLAAMITLAASVVIYIAIGFAVAGPGVRGGHTY